MKRLLVFFSFCLWAFAALSQYPSLKGTLVEHSYYALSYRAEWKHPEWVYYKLTPAYVNGAAERASSFKVDPKVKHSPKPTDYTGTGYDRGHLCPAASMRVNDKAMKETFFMTNMSPQKPSFNRGIWKTLEEKEREWTLQEDSIVVICGPVLKSEIDRLPSGIPVPSHYYKIVYDLSAPQKMIGFVIPNQKGEKPLDRFSVSVDVVENITGIDFFYHLPHEVQQQLESVADAQLWFR